MRLSPWISCAFCAETHRNIIVGAANAIAPAPANVVYSEMINPRFIFNVKCGVSFSVAKDLW